MNPTEQDIETLLRHAPQPKAPAGLKNQLTAQVQLPAPVHPRETQPIVTARPTGGWLRRWWPVLAPAAASLACAAVVTVQQVQIQNLKADLATFSPHPAVAATVTSGVGAGGGAAADSTARVQPEIEQLKKQVSDLTAEIARLEQMRAENNSLRIQLANPVASLPPELQADVNLMAEAKVKAERIACANNMKQIGLAFRVWASDNMDRFPANVPVKEGGAMGMVFAYHGFLVMSNELGTPKLLVCPADTNRVAAADWASYGTANLSYQYVGATATESEPNAAMVICPIHGNVLLCDGSVQTGLAKTHPESLVERDGKLYLSNNPALTAPVPGPATPEIDRMMRQLDQSGRQDTQPRPARRGTGQPGGPPGGWNQ